MRIKIAALFLGYIALTAPRAWAQAPGEPPPGPPGMAGPGAPPGPQAYPPPTWSPPGPPLSPAFAPPPPMQPASPPQAPPPPEAPPIQVAGRVGFGIGAYAAPGLGSSGAGSAASALAALGPLGGIQPYGATLGIRWWAKERLAVLPSLTMSISHTSTPSSADGSGRFIPERDSTDGSIAPALSLGYAAYRGKSTRFLLLGGVGFSYAAQALLVQLSTDTDPGGALLRYVTAKTLAFTVPFGFALEQFFTSRISVVVGAQAPLFEFTSTKVGLSDASTRVGANFNATQLGASLYFYTD